MRAVQASGAPSRGRPQPKSHYRAGDFNGIDAPWALSALPECLLPRSVYRARKIAAVLVHLPPGAKAVQAGTALWYHDCKIAVGRDDANVTRGSDRFHIPPHARFYQTSSKLILVRFSGSAELRVYTVSNL